MSNQAGSAKMYYDKDADMGLLKGKKIAVIGYGSQGFAQALNLKDSGIDVIIGQRGGNSENFKKAVADGFKPVSAADATKAADWVHILLPDQTQKKVWDEEIKPNLKKGAIISFSHGFNVRFDQIVPPADCDVVMIAPKSPGYMVRRQYEEGKGVPSLIAVYQNASGKAKELALAFSKAIGSTRAGVLETTFAEETETDLFGEQVVLCGGMVELIKKGFETLVEAGYQPEIAYFECLHECKLIIDLIWEGGVSHMNEYISDTAEYGEYKIGKRIVNDETKKEMKKVLEEIRSGEFAHDWILENMTGRVRFNQSIKDNKEHKIEVVGEKLRAMMPWLKKK